ncbi:MAG: DUF6531 domain-containing protein, partial [Desulfovibrionales bacterium]
MRIYLVGRQGSYLNVSITQDIEPPTVTLSAAPASVLQGGSSTLSWSSTNAESLTINQGVGSVASSGSTTVTPTSTTTYTITATNPVGTVTDQETLTVLESPAASLSVEPVSIPENTSAELTWRTENAESVTIDNGIGSVDSSGTLTVSPSGTTTYTLTAEGPGGTATDSALLTIVAPQPTVHLSADKSSILEGEPVSLTWESENAERAEITPGIGSVPVNGSIEISPSVTTHYTISVTGPGGTAESSIPIMVTYPPPSVSLTVSPETISNGESATLAWESSHAQNVMIDQNIGTVTASGSLVVSPTGSTTYTITATGKGGTVTATATVSIQTRPDGAELGVPGDSHGEGGLLGTTLSITNGNVLEVRKDISFPSPHQMGLVLTGSYNSRSNTLGTMGFGWSHSYTPILSQTSLSGSNYLTIEDETGRIRYFSSANGTYHGAFGENSSVVPVSEGYDWIKENGLVYLKGA